MQRACSLRKHELRIRIPEKIADPERTDRSKNICSFQKHFNYLQGYILCISVIPPPPHPRPLFLNSFFPRRISLRRAGRGEAEDPPAEYLLIFRLRIHSPPNFSEVGSGTALSKSGSTTLVASSDVDPDWLNANPDPKKLMNADQKIVRIHVDKITKLISKFLLKVRKNF